MVKFSRDNIVAAHSALGKKPASNMQPFVYYIDRGCLRWVAWDGEAFVALDEFMPSTKMLQDAEQDGCFLVARISPLVYAGEHCVNPQLATDDEIKAAGSLLDAKRKGSPTSKDYEWEYRVVYWELARRTNARNPRYRPSTVGTPPRDSAATKRKPKTIK